MLEDVMKGAKINFFELGGIDLLCSFDINEFCWVVIMMNNPMFALLITTHCGRCHVMMSSSVMPDVINLW